jgi:hypothetical protein
MNPPELIRLLQAVQDGLRAARSDMPADEARAFERQLTPIAQTAKDPGIDADAVAAKLIGVLRAHPAISKVLADRDPTVRAALATPQQPPPPSASAPKPAPARQPPPRHLAPITQAAAASQQPGPVPDVGPAATGSGGGTGVRVPDGGRGGEADGGGGNAKRSILPRMAAGSGLQTFREIVAGLLALGVVATMLLVAFRTLGQIGDSAKVQQTKDLLTVLLGPAGVVLGYYFGRGPAETAATHASKRADDAQADRDAVRARARNAERSLTETIDQMSIGGRGLGAPDNAETLRRIRDQLHDV